jgi:CTP:phosphocholine cytidylyltransferase-like protein
MDTLKQQVRDVIAGYAGKVLNGYSFWTRNDDESLYTVIDVARSHGQQIVGVSVIVRIVDNFVVIDRDQNDKLVVDALTQAGIPREQIVLAYAGEALPEPV